MDALALTADPFRWVTDAGAVAVTKLRVVDRRGGQRFTSTILPPYMRRSAKVTEVLPLLYLRGLSTGDFAPALGEFFGIDAGLSASTIQRLTETWRAGARQRAPARRRRRHRPVVPAGAGRGAHRYRPWS